MPFLLIIIGVTLAVAAYRGTQGDLGNALAKDLPGYFLWAAALGGTAGLGFVPGLKEISRWLLALVVLVLVLRNYQAVLQQFTSLQHAPAPQAAVATPAEAYVANPSNPQITQGQITGTGNINTVALAQPQSNPLGAYDPAGFLTAFESGVGGFGGVA